MDFYTQNGFCIFNEMLVENTIHNIYDKIIYITNNILNKNYKNDKKNSLENKIDNIYSNLQEIYLQDINYYFELVRMNGIFSEILEIKELFCNEKILEKLKNLNIKNISVPITAQIHLFCDFAKNKDYRNGKFGLDTHQDWPQMRGSLNNVIFWIALNNIDENNCPLDIIPKSHLNGYILKDKLKDFSENEFETVKLSAGDSICFSSWLIHKTGTFKNNAKFRFAISLRYNDLDDNYFKKTKYYTSYNTIMNREEFCTDIPNKNDINYYFN